MVASLLRLAWLDWPVSDQSTLRCRQMDGISRPKPDRGDDAVLQGLRRIVAKDPDRQTADIHIHAVLINRFNARGTAEIVRVAGRPRGKGALRLRLAVCNNTDGMSTAGAVTLRRALCQTATGIMLAASAPTTDQGLPPGEPGRRRQRRHDATSTCQSHTHAPMRKTAGPV